MPKNSYLKELLWLIGVGVVSEFVQYDVRDLYTATALDINLHDTYFLIRPGRYHFTDFILLAFIVYLIRAVFDRYKNTMIKIVLMFTNTILICLLFQLALQLMSIIRPNVNGWTVYPPLSALPKVEPPTFSFLQVILRTFLIIEIFLIIHLCFVSVKVGMGIRKGH